MKDTTGMKPAPTDSVERNVKLNKQNPSHLGTGRHGKLPVAWAPIMHGETVIKVFWMICAHANSDGTCYPSRKTIAKLAGIHVSHVTPALRKLEEICAIKTIPKRGHSSFYRLLDPPQPLSDSDNTHYEGVLSDSDNPPLSDSDKRVLSNSDNQNKPRNISITTSRVCAPARELKTPTDEESRILDVCYQWSLGVSLPMPADLVERYRAMIATHDLPRRPGT